MGIFFSKKSGNYVVRRAHATHPGWNLWNSRPNQGRVSSAHNSRKARKECPKKKAREGEGGRGHASVQVTPLERRRCASGTQGPEHDRENERRTSGGRSGKEIIDMMNTSVGGRRFPCGSKASARGGVRSTGTQRNNNNVFGERGLGFLGGAKVVSSCRRSNPQRSQAVAARSEGANSNKDKERERLTYAGAGVDIDAGAELVRRIQALSKGTGVDIGGFGGLFPIGGNRFLVAGTDGVGTKLKLAFEADKHDTIGVDLVAMSVNDIITLGATPLFFLDYFATSKLDVDRAEEVIKGIVDGCAGSDCVLLGGETAEMPGFYADGEYDLSGFAVGMVDQADVIDGKSCREGDKLVALPSSGVHSNGFSLARKVLEVSQLDLHAEAPFETTGRTVGEVLLEPTRLYVKDVMRVHKSLGLKIKGAVHVTGGGFYDNIPRCLPDGLGVAVNKGTWEVPPVFQWMQEVGNVAEDEMFRTFNMGVGFIMVMAPEDAEAACAACEGSSIIGEVKVGEGVEFH